MTESTTVTPVILPTLIDAQRKTTEQLSRLYEESLRFASLRSEENTRALRELAASRGLPETVSAWTSYVTRTTQQYSEEFKLLAAICAEPTREFIGDEPAVLKETEAAVAEAVEVAEDTMQDVAEAVAETFAPEPVVDATDEPRAD